MKRALLILLCAGCTLPFPSVPDGAALSCAADGECPPDFRCDGARCVQAQSACGDGRVSLDEVCDDGNNNPADACDQCRAVSWQVDLAVGRRVERLGPVDFPPAPQTLSVTPTGDVLFTTNGNNVPGVFAWDRSLDLVVPVAGTGALVDFEAVAELDLLGTLVPLKVPTGAVAGLDGAIWITDALIPRLLRIDPDTRVLSSVAGTGVGEVDNALEAAAVAGRFSFPADVALDALGRPHVIDNDAVGIGVIKRLDPDGFVRRVAGSYDAVELGDGGPATDALIEQATNLAFGDDGALYLSTLRGARVRRVDVDGTISTLVGGGDIPIADGVARTDARLSFLRCVAFHQGALYFVHGFSLWRVDGDVVREVQALTLSPSGPVRMTSDGDALLMSSGGFGALRVADGTQEVVLGGGVPEPTVPLATSTDFRLGVHRVSARGEDVMLTFGAGLFRIEERLTIEFGGAGVKDVDLTPDGATWFATATEVYRRTDASDELVVGGDDDSPPPESATAASDVALPRDDVRRIAVRGDELFLAVDPPSPQPGESTVIYRVDLNTGSFSPFAGGGVSFVEGAAALDTRLGALQGMAVTDDALVYAEGGSLREVQGGVVTERYNHDRVIVAVAADGDDVYFADNVTGIGTVYRLRGGTLERLLGGNAPAHFGDGGLGVDASVLFVADLDVDGERLYVSAQRRVRRLNLSTGIVTSVAGPLFPDDGDIDDVRVRQPGGLLVTGGGLLVADGARATLRRVAGREVRTVIGYPDRLTDDAPGGDGLFSRSLRRPAGIALVDGDIWIAEAAGSLRQISGDLSSARDRLTEGLVRPTGVTWDDARGRVYIADAGAHVIRALELSNDALSIVAGVEGLAGFVGGDAVNARFDTPSAVLLAPPNDLYVADTNNHRVRRIDLATGSVETVLGIGVGSSFGEGPAAGLPVDAPAGLFIDAHENLYVTSRTTVRQVSDGRVRTIYGAERETFPEALTECLGDIVALDNVPQQLVVADRCAGYLVELTRVVD